MRSMCCLFQSYSLTFWHFRPPKTPSRKRKTTAVAPATQSPAKSPR